MEYSKTCVIRPLSRRPKIGFQDQLSLNAGQKYCRILLTFIKLPFVIKIFVLSIFLVAVLHLFYCIHVHCTTQHQSLKMLPIILSTVDAILKKKIFFLENKLDKLCISSLFELSLLTLFTPFKQCMLKN